MVIALSEPCCVFLVDDSKVYWQWFGPTRAGWQRKGSGPLFCFSIVAQRPCVRTSPSGGRQDKKQDLLSFIFPIFFLKPFSSIPLRDCHFDLCMRLSMARHTASSHGDTSILIQTWFSHLKAYASTYAQYSNGYPNLVLPSFLAELQGPVQAEEGRIRNKKTALQRVTSSGNSKLLSNGNASTAT